MEHNNEVYTSLRGRVVLDQIESNAHRILYVEHYILKAIAVDTWFLRDKHRLPENLTGQMIGVAGSSSGTVPYASGDKIKQVPLIKAKHMLCRQKNSPETFFYS